MEHTKGLNQVTQSIWFTSNPSLRYFCSDFTNLYLYLLGLVCQCLRVGYFSLAINCTLLWEGSVIPAQGIWRYSSVIWYIVLVVKGSEIKRYREGSPSWWHSSSHRSLVILSRQLGLWTKMGQWGQNTINKRIEVTKITTKSPVLGTEGVILGSLARVTTSYGSHEPPSTIGFHNDVSKD